jgi:hypothetical protein
MITYFFNLKFMKKLFILLAFVTLSAMSAKVYAQSSGTNPAPGAKHSYSITNNGNTVLWTVTKGDLSTPAGTDVVISAGTSYATDITWAAGLTTGAWYYVHVVESDGTCTNEKVLPVQISASQFYLTLAAANETQCYTDDVTVSIDLSNPALINYDHGNAIVVFTVTPSGLSNSYSGYSFDLNIVVPGGFDATPVFSGNAALSGGVVTVDDNAAVTITYNIDNNNILTNITDALGTAADFTATVTIANGKAINGVSDNGTGAKTDETSVSRPHTSGISTN